MVILAAGVSRQNGESKKSECQNSDGKITKHNLLSDIIENVKNS